MSSPGSGDHGRSRFSVNLSALAQAQKPSRGTPAYSRLVNRPAARVVAAALHSFQVTPNMATAASATLSLCGLVLLCVVEPVWLMSVGVAVFLAGGYVLDSVDGQLARLRGAGSVQGEWLDHTIDCAKTAAVHLAVAVSWFRFPPIENPAVLLIPLGFSVVQSVTYFGLILMPYLRGTSAAAPVERSVAAEGPLRRWLILPTDYGFLCWIFVLLALPQVFLVVYVILFLLAAALLVLALHKWWGELGAIDRRRRDVDA